MPAAFGELFVNDCGVDAVPPGAAVYGSWRLAILPQDEPYLPAGFATVGAGAHPLVRGLGKAWWSLTGNAPIAIGSWCSRNSIRAVPRAQMRGTSTSNTSAYRSTFATSTASCSAASPCGRRSPAPPLQWAAANLDDDVVGVQVRTWRDDARRHRKYHLPALRRLTQLLDAAGPSARFLVVSDSDDVAPMLGERYGAQRVLSYPRSTSRADSWLTPRGIMEDLIDMLLLARTQRLFASYLSTFSEVAWWLGGTTARVSVF